MPRPSERRRGHRRRLSNAPGAYRRALERQSRCASAEKAIWREFRRNGEASNRRDLEAVLLNDHPDFEFCPPRQLADSGIADPSYRGRDGYLRFMSGWFSAWGDFRSGLRRRSTWGIAALSSGSSPVAPRSGAGWRPRDGVRTGDRRDQNPRFSNRHGPSDAQDEARLAERPWSSSRVESIPGIAEPAARPASVPVPRRVVGPALCFENGHVFLTWSPWRGPVALGLGGDRLRGSPAAAWLVGAEGPLVALGVEDAGAFSAPFGRFRCEHSGGAGRDRRCEGGVDVVYV